MSDLCIKYLVNIPQIVIIRQKNNKVNIKIPKNVVKYNKLLTFTAYSLACYVYKKMVQYVYALASNNWHNNTHVLTDKRESYQEA